MNEMIYLNMLQNMHADFSLCNPTCGIFFIYGIFMAIIDIQNGSDFIAKVVL